MPDALPYLRGLWGRRSARSPEGASNSVLPVVPTYDVTPFASEIDIASMDVIRWAPVWMTRAERLLLYTLTFCLHPARYLEVGTLEGGSALIVCAAMDAVKSDGRLVCVDPEPKVSDENWERLKHRTRIVKGYSPQALSAASSISGQPFDLVLIDGDHTAIGVEQDANAVLPLVAPGGHMVFHDSFFTDVAAGIDRFAHANREHLMDMGPVTREVTRASNEGSGPTTWGGLRLMQVRP
jgi:predicted O-methyltransferase YrrM